LGKINGDFQCEFICNRSTTNQTFYICQIPEKRQKCRQTVYHFIHSQKAYGSGEKLYSILARVGVPTELIRLLMFLNRIYARVGNVTDRYVNALYSSLAFNFKPVPVEARQI
jgi:hypothetical protein